ncbi:MAG TPA: hypothetical protein VMK16_14350, partial [Acidimicrobiales bacterium]|nr:hypothetical protein [Acidimicrobiales bacterium]
MKCERVMPDGTVCPGIVEDDGFCDTCGKPPAGASTSSGKTSVAPAEQHDDEGVTAPTQASITPDITRPTATGRTARAPGR